MRLPLLTTCLAVVVAVAPVALPAKGNAPPLPSMEFTDSPAGVPAPPALAKPSLYMTHVETATASGQVAAFRTFLDANPVTDFVAVTDAIPSIEGFTYLSGTWPEPGAIRRVELAGGHSVHERVLANSDGRFAYQIWNITAPAGRVIDHIMGEFLFEQVENETAVTWSYNIKPNIFVARPAIGRYLRNDFGPFMNAGLSGVVAAYTP